VEEEADLGLAYDGDADRLGVVDDRGRMVFGDRVLILLARDLLASNPGATVISEVKASSIFFSEVEKAGGRAVMCATGHSIIKEEMAGRDALLAGEMSGHIFFRDRYYGYDDALYASLRLLEVLAGSGSSLSGLLDTIPAMLATPEIREDCPEELKVVLVDRVRRILAAKYRVTDIDGVRVEFPSGWGLLRASNTQPVLVMRFEAATAEDLASYEESMRRLLKEAREDLDV
jgi:phosphomannomutase/phosphoglucomutase